MYKVLLAATAVVLMSGSSSYAVNPLIPNDNDNHAARSFIIEQSHGARIRRSDTKVFASPYPGGGMTMSTSTARRVSPGFLLHGGDHKKVENQYAR